MRPGSTAFAKRPTENAEKTSMLLGCGGGIACRMTVRQAIARATTDARLRPTATATHSQRTFVNASPIALKLGPRHHSSTATRPMKMIVIAKRVAFDRGNRLSARLTLFMQRLRCRCRGAAARWRPTRRAAVRACARRCPSPAGVAHPRAAPRRFRRAHAHLRPETPSRSRAS